MAQAKNVKYERLVYDEMPERPARNSEQEVALAEIKADPTLVNKAICIAQYGQPTAATAAANIMRQRHGQPEVEGWTFATRKITLPGEDEERTGLFVRFNPNDVKEGAAEQFATVKAQREAARKEKAAAKKAEKAKTAPVKQAEKKAEATGKLK